MRKKSRAEKESSRKWCRRYGIEEQRLYEMEKLKLQFRQVLQEVRFLSPPSDHSDDDGDAENDDGAARADETERGGKRKRKDEVSRECMALFFFVASE
jgi:hypothetical protein